MNFIQYVKQVWKAKPIGGTPFSPDRLNHMEEGIKNNNSMISELNNNITHNTCVNLLNPSFHSLTQNGLTINNDNGVYTINGTCSETTVFTLQSNIEIASGKYKLTGCPQGGSTTSFKLDFEYKGNSIGADYGNGSIINKTSNDTFKYLRIVVYTGAILNNAVFKPMLTTDLSALYDDYVSYTGNTGRLNADVALLKNNLDNNIIGTLDNHSIGSENNINMDSELFSSHKPLYIHAIATQNPSSIIGMPQGAYGYGVLITLLSKYESTWGTCQIYIPHAGEVSRDIYVRTLGDTYKRKPSWRRITSTQIEATQ